MVNVAQGHHLAPRFSQLSSTIPGTSAFNSEEPQGFKKAAATQHITSSCRKVQNPEGEKRAHLFHRSFYKIEVKFPQSLLKRLPPTFQWSELYHISTCKSISSEGNGITRIFLDQLRLTSGARERFNLPQSTWSPNTKQKNGFR